MILTVTLANGQKLREQFNVGSYPVVELVKALIWGLSHASFWVDGTEVHAEDIERIEVAR